MQCGLWNEFIDEDILDVDNDTCCLSNTNFFSMTVEQHYSYICMYVCMYVCGSNVLPNFIDICFK